MLARRAHWDQMRATDTEHDGDVLAAEPPVFEVDAVVHRYRKGTRANVDAALDTPLRMKDVDTLIGRNGTAEMQIAGTGSADDALDLIGRHDLAHP